VASELAVEAERGLAGGVGVAWKHLHHRAHPLVLVAWPKMALRWPDHMRCRPSPRHLRQWGAPAMLGSGERVHEVEHDKANAVVYAAADMVA
jgi:hypothetical protein